jgi:hypothetical protein
MTNIPVKESKREPIPTTDKVCLYGDACVGKSFSLATALKCLQEDGRFIYLMSERNAPLGFEAGIKHYKIIPKEGQIIYTMAEDTSQSSFANLARSVRNFATKPQDLKHDPRDLSTNKDKYGFLLKVLDSLEKFSGKDYVTQETVQIGDVRNLTSKDILVIDGLSPIASEVWKTLYGDILLYSGYDYSGPQQLLYQIIFALSKIQANVILLAHEKEYTEGEGLQQKLKFIGPDTKVGEANFKSMMGNFTDIFRAKKQGPKWVWEASGNISKAYCASRKIPAKDGLEPDFSLYGFFK